jgi:hypothetical protein
MIEEEGIDLNAIDLQVEKEQNAILTLKGRASEDFYLIL